MKSLNQWKQEYRELSIDDKLRRAPNFYGDRANAAMYVTYPKVSTANGLTKAILTFLKFKGHYANRISSQGQVHIHHIPKFNLLANKIQYFDQARWTKGTTTRGISDITTIINGHSVWIEVKIGRDKQSEHQLKAQAQIEAAGGIYYIARDMQEFYDWYYRTFCNKPDFSDPDISLSPEGYE